MAHPSVEERQAHGRSLREKVPRKTHGIWKAPRDRADPVDLLESQAATRVPDLMPIRYRRMRVSPFAFLRGSAIVMAEDLAHTPTTGIQTQLCGDCHLANFGLYASPERTLLFDLNDFDETHPGPWEWDVKRLAASCYVACRTSGFSEVDCRTAVLAAVSSYRRHMADFAAMDNLAIWYSRVAADDLLDMITNQRTMNRIQKELAKSRQRINLQALSKLTKVVDGRLVIADDPPLIMRVSTAEHDEFARGLFHVYARTLQGAQRRLLERYDLVDVAFKVVGVGSVGTRCYIFLLLGRDVNDPLFLQAKQADASVLEAHPSKSAFANQGERVVAGQELMQAASDIFLGWLRGFDERDYYVRQLQDMKGSAEIENFSPSDLALWASACGWALARAHARAGDPVQIAAYLGASATFDQAIAAFAEAYADQVERDYQAFLAAIKSGRITAATAG
jgi:uncharacterized protein (DUF2252 family)